MWKLTLLLIAACGGVTTKRDEPPPLDSRAKLRGSELLIAAVAAGDPSKISNLLHPDLAFGGLWFPGSECRTQFPKAGQLAASGREALAKCLATIRLATSTRSSSHPDIAVFTYAPGIEIEVRFVLLGADPKVRWIGYVSRRPLDDDSPTITQAALYATEADTIKLDDDSRAQLKKAVEGDTPEFAWLRLCIDREGAVTDVQVRLASSPTAYKIWSTKAAQWRFHPFALDGQPSAVCSLVHVEYPFDAARTSITREGFPLPATADANGIFLYAPYLGRRRKAGETQVVPVDEDKTKVQRSGVKLLFTIVEVCIDSAGKVQSTSVLRSFGLESYDRRIVAAIRAWQFEPILLDGAPVPVCTNVTFIYQQL